HSRLDPRFEEDRIDGVGGAHDNIGVFDGVLRLRRRRNLDAEEPRHGIGKGSAVFWIRAEAANARNSRTVQAAMSCAPACQPEPRRPMRFAFARARCLIAMPLAAPTRMR